MARKNSWINIIGQKHDFIEVVGMSDLRRKRDGAILWNVKCNCGKIILIPKCYFDKYKSCGCKKTELQAAKLSKKYKEIPSKMWNSIQRNAKERNLIFNITLKEIWMLFLKQNGKCALSGMDISFSDKKGILSTASLDRIDSTQGYVLDNIQWIHKHINFMKQQYNENYFFQLCRTIISYQDLAISTVSNLSVSKLM